MSIQWRHNLLF